MAECRVFSNEKLSEEQLTILEIKAKKSRKTYVRFKPNKHLLNIKPEDNTCFVDLAHQQQLVIWRGLYKNHEKLITEWDRIRKIANFSSILHNEKRVAFDYGTISLLEVKPKYTTEEVFYIFGIETLMSVAVVDVSKLEELAARGFLCWSSINKYRTIVDVKLRFLLMEIEKEKAMFEFNSQRLRMLSEHSINQTGSQA